MKKLVIELAIIILVAGAVVCAGNFSAVFAATGGPAILTSENTDTDDEVILPPDTEPVEPGEETPDEGDYEESPVEDDSDGLPPEEDVLPLDEEDVPPADEEPVSPADEESFPPADEEPVEEDKKVE